MSQFFEIHPTNPQPRLIARAVEILHRGGVIAYPTDSSYALGCHIGDKKAMDKIRRIRQLDKDHNFTLVCSDLSELSIYAKVDNSAYRTIKSLTPGPYTFILDATREVPRRLQHPKRNTIGIRVPDNAIAHAMIDSLGEPIMSSTLTLPDSDINLNDPHEIREKLEHSLDLIIDGGSCPMEPTTVVDLISEPAKIVRQGRGDVGIIT